MELSVGICTGQSIAKNIGSIMQTVRLQDYKIVNGESSLIID